jgi:transposase
MHALFVVVGLNDPFPLRTDIFLEFLENVVVLDNVFFHHPVDLREKSKSTGAKILYWPPYFPENSPIENMWSNIKKR